MIRVKSSVELVCSTQTAEEVWKDDGGGRKRMKIDYLVTREGNGD